VLSAAMLSVIPVRTSDASMVKSSYGAGSSMSETVNRISLNLVLVVCPVNHSSETSDFHDAQSERHHLSKKFHQVWGNEVWI
jgi:hypothetical protein